MTAAAEAPLAQAEATLAQADGRRRRKPVFYVICIGLMCLGAVVSAFAFTRASHSQQVVAVATTIHAGQTITAGDLKLVEVNSDTELLTVPRCSGVHRRRAGRPARPGRRQHRHPGLLRKRRHPCPGAGHRRPLPDRRADAGRPAQHR